MNDPMHVALLTPRARAFARELAACAPSRSGMGFDLGWPGISNATMSSPSIAAMAAGMGFAGAVPQHDATDQEKAQISLWAKQAGQDNQDSYNRAVAALAAVNPWGDSGPNWWTTVGNGGWYAYPDVTTMLSTTVAERHPEWLTAVGTAVGTEADLTVGGGAVGASLGSPTAVNVDAISTGIVNTGGGALTTAGDVLSGGAVAVQKSWAEWFDSYKWLLLAGAAGVVVVGGGYAYVYGRGMRRPNPRKKTWVARKDSRGRYVTRRSSS